MGCCDSKVADDDVDPSVLVLKAVVDGDSSWLTRLLSAGLDPNVILNHSEYGRITPLILAVGRGDVQCTRILINGGANLNTACGRQNTTAAHLAATNGNNQCLRVLLENGASTNYCDTDGDGPLHMAALKGHLPCVLELLKKGVNLNAANGKGWTPLHYACLKGQLSVVLALRAAGANVHATDHDGLKPGALALAGGHPECLAILTA